MALVKIAGTDSVSKFNEIFSAAHARCQRGGGLQYEPHFVRSLISGPTVAALNNACPSLYDGARNKVSFRAAFLHQSPFASFTASGAALCRRELADAMFVAYVTEPDAAGVHTVVRRSACLLMFKTSDELNPRAFAFDPAAGPPPSGTDEQQFYLFNRWPSFELQTGSKLAPKVHGNFDIAVQGVAPPTTSHDVGKFAVVWQSPASFPSTWLVDANPVHWLAGEPIPNFLMKPQDASLGTLLDEFIGGDADIGRDFYPQPPAVRNWNALMGTLLGYPLPGPAALGSPLPSVNGNLRNKSWASQLRDVNPNGLGFMTLNSGPVGMGLIESVDAAFATIAQHSRELTGSSAWPFATYPGWGYFGRSVGNLQGHVLAEDDEGSPFPVLIATVSRFQSEEQPRESSRLTLSMRADACQLAARCLRELRSALP
ncbi:hypothetical protein AB4Z46_02590 [Variovorax sp. M-6]|uniref:hypothetical protein n=1 Tax=Variovorax sp. M-6 TaxID=3233041 RepID=UPI003F9A15DD